MPLVRTTSVVTDAVPPETSVGINGNEPPEGDKNKLDGDIIFAMKCVALNGMDDRFIIVMVNRYLLLSGIQMILGTTFTQVTS